MKKAVYIVIAIIIVWFGIRFIIGGSEDTWICDNGEWVKHGVPSAPKPDTPCNDRVVNPSIETKNTTESNDEKRYDINVDLPVVKDVNNSENVNAFIEEKVNRIVNEFKDNINEWDVPSDFDKEMKSGLWIKFEKHLLTKNHVSLQITVSEYFIGAAHPNNYSLAINYNMDRKGEITLDKLFNVSQEEYLSRISELTLADLKEQFVKLDMDPETMMFESGVEPKLENFSNFNLTEDGIAFNFDQYQIAPYAAGEFYVIILYEEIFDIMDEVEN